MIWLYILLGFLFLAAVILLLPIKLYASYSSDFSCLLYIGFVKLSLYPSKPEKGKTKKAKKKKPQKEEKKDKPEKEKKNLIKEKGLSWLADVIKKVAKLATSVLKDFFGHILIKKLSLSISVAGKDAADTAIKYGKCCAAIYPCVSIITSSVKCSDYGVDIMPNFDENAKTEIELELVARVFVFNILGLVFRHGFKALKLFAELT